MEERPVCLDGKWKSLSDQIVSLLFFPQVQRSAIEGGGVVLSIQCEGVYPEAAEVVIAREDNFVLNPEQVSIETA